MALRFSLPLHRGCALRCVPARGADPSEVYRDVTSTTEPGTGEITSVVPQFGSRSSEIFIHPWPPFSTRTRTHPDLVGHFKFILRIRAGTTLDSLRVRQVVPERRKEHILCSARVASRRRSPSVAVDVRVLRSPLKPAFGTVVEAVPETD